MLSHLKKLNSPSYMNMKPMYHLTNSLDYNNIINPSNWIDSSDYKSNQMSNTEIIYLNQKENILHPSSYHNELNQLVTSQSYLTKDNDLSIHETGICHILSGLTNRQRYICLQHTGLIWAMLEGTHLSMNECIHQFKHEQWNCSAVNLLYRTHRKSSNLPLIHGLEGILQRGSRETAFLSSSWSAGVVQAITRACSRGQMGTCDCDPHRREGQGRDAEGIFTWGGCSDPIRFGMRLARLFLDANDEEHRNAAVQREQELHEQRIQLLSSMRLNNQNKQNTRKLQRIHRFQRSFNNSTSDQHFKPNVTENVKNLIKPMNKSNTILSPRELQMETLQIIQTKARTLMNLHNKKAGRRVS
ncbi:wingless-type MMTV integration site family, member 2 [Schistosoma bovis]|uniref:Protein Wnt n=1 Tax=Schistosoma bovis TaxID=6184 RepID=A0A430Q2T5_SCHBO|nr:wingless-type MMTV integration site family, member 2 [Schistosoma bovis]